MNLGEKLRIARAEVGLSQRQLCDGLITRNMLSQIENGIAKPSMKTLTALAERLGKSVSYFLEENAVFSPNQAVMEVARQSFDDARFEDAAKALEQYRQPDPVYDREKQLLLCLIHFALAEEALAQGKEPYALSLLEKADTAGAYCQDALRRQRLLLLGRIKGERVSYQLPDLDEELLLRAREALADQQINRATALLEAAENQSSPQWLFLRGQVWAVKKQYSEAARCFHGAETGYPEETASWLEICYRELEDYRQAYNYARKYRR